MSTDTMQDRHRSAEERLTALGQRIDDVRNRAREDRTKASRAVERRLDVVRAKDAEIRTELRRMAEEEDASWEAYFDQLDREFDELDDEVVVMEAQLEADAAKDWEAYERATAEEIAAYDRMLESSRERADRAKTDARERSNEAVEKARAKVREAGEALRRARDEAAQKWTAKRDEINADMDALDAAVIEAVATLETSLVEEGSKDDR